MVRVPFRKLEFKVFFLIDKWSPPADFEIYMAERLFWNISSLPYIGLRCLNHHIFLFKSKSIPFWEAVAMQVFYIQL